MFLKITNVLSLKVSSGFLYEYLFLADIHFYCFRNTVFCFTAFCIFRSQLTFLTYCNCMDKVQCLNFGVHDTVWKQSTLLPHSRRRNIKNLNYACWTMKVLNELIHVMSFLTKSSYLPHRIFGCVMIITKQVDFRTV